jgi:hypothetical protein
MTSVTSDRDRALIERPSVRSVLTRSGIGRASTGSGAGTGAAADAHAAADADTANVTATAANAVADTAAAAAAGDAVLSPAAEEAARAALLRIAAGQMPWYLRVLIGAGAWIGASFLLSAVTGLVLVGSGDVKNVVAILLGIIFIVVSTVFRRRTAGTFATQLALVVSSTGQLLVIGGVGAETSSVVAGCFAAVLSSIPLIVWFPDRVQRFSATLVVCGALVAVVVDSKMPHGLEAIALATVALTLWLCRLAPRATIEAHAEIVEPIVYGLVVAMLGLLVTHTVVMMVDIFNERWLSMGPIAVVGFVLALAVLAESIFLEHDVPFGRLDALATLAGILALGAITRSTPAIVATVLLLVLGFDRRARGLIALATVFFLGFTAAFYYDLHMTLLQKSGILILSGAVCLAAWAAVRARPAAGAASVTQAA